MTRVAIAGAAGRMGARLAALAHEHPQLTLAGAFERPGHKDMGRDIGDVVGIGKTGVVLRGSIAEVLADVDVIIDFTAPEATIANLEAASQAGKAMVIGTTGLTKEQGAKLSHHAGKVPCVFASNMSLGVNLLLKVLGDIARALGDDYDVEVIEAHHRLKKDAPSGTAMSMAQALAEALGRDLEEDGCYARKGLIGERPPRQIGIQTIRAGDIVGEHTIIFGGLGERIEVTHRASSRDTFARGALKAALWVHGRPDGLYSMQDVLGVGK